MLTTGRDNTLRFYDGGLKEQAVMPHNNNTGRWVMPFRATFGPGNVAVCGSMKRTVRCHTKTHQQHETPQPWTIHQAPTSADALQCHKRCSCAM